MTTRHTETGDITAILRDWRAGDAEALERLTALVHADLRRIARVHMRRERADHTLQPTALVNEVYMRLANLRAISWRDRVHFFAMASRLMRRVLVDAGRRRRAGRRGRSFVRVTLSDVKVADNAALAMPDVLALDAALARFATVDPRKSRLVELRFFGGLTMEEAAETLEISVETAARDWRAAKIWLRRELSSPPRSAD